MKKPTKSLVVNLHHRQIRYRIPKSRTHVFFSEPQWASCSSASARRGAFKEPSSNCFRSVSIEASNSRRCQCHFARSIATSGVKFTLAQFSAAASTCEHSQASQAHSAASSHPPGAMKMRPFQAVLHLCRATTQRRHRCIERTLRVGMRLAITEPLDCEPVPGSSQRGAIIPCRAPTMYINLQHVPVGAPANC